MIALLLAAGVALPQAEASAAPAPAVAPQRVKTPGDPNEDFNRRMYKFQDGLDRKVLRPAAMGYSHVVPRFLRSAIRNFFSNLNEPVVALNFLLQHKFKSVAQTVVRFGINSTIGIGGTIDVGRGKAFELPHRPNGFGDTLGYYGVKPGAYLFLPVLGPTTVRDFFGGQADGLVLPLAVGKPFNRIYYALPKAVLTGLDLRAERDGDLKALLGSALDPYATLRSVYLQDRAGEIAELKGQAPAEDDPYADPQGAAPEGKASELDDPLADPAAAAPATPPPPAAPPATR